MFKFNFVTNFLWILSKHLVHSEPLSTKGQKLKANFSKKPSKKSLVQWRENWIWMLSKRTTFMNAQTWIHKFMIISNESLFDQVIRTKTKLCKQLKLVNSIVKRRQWTILNRSPVFFLPKALWFSPLAPTSKASGNVFPILLPFSFGKSDWGKRVAASSKNNLGQTFAQTHTQNHTLPRGRCLQST